MTKRYGENLIFQFNNYNRKIRRKGTPAGVEVTAVTEVTISTLCVPITTIVV